MYHQVDNCFKLKYFYILGDEFVGDKYEYLNGYIKRKLNRTDTVDQIRRTE